MSEWLAKVCGMAVLLALCAAVPAFGAERLPNIVFILADDLGYGDVGVYNPQSKIATPNIDRVARQGTRFTDAHTGSTCIPSRYALITGRYLFRNSRAFNKEALIEPGRLTVASLLKQAGYATAMVGKWHLGYEEPFASYAARMFEVTADEHVEPFDYSRPLRGGPVDHGFDSYFGIHASLDVAPYFFIENDRAVEAPTDIVDERHSPGVRSIQGEFWRRGLIAPHFKHEDVLPRFADRAVQYLQSQAGSRQPFFLYLALPAPHAPWLPVREFRDKSGAGMYGDFVMQVDDVVGRVVAALEKAGKTQDTLLIFTSDNGPTWYAADIKKYGHRSSGEWRGMKADAWEGGHRMPFIARWPAKITAGTSSAQLVSLTDMLATFASLTGQKLPANAGEDSLDVLPVLLGKSSKPPRDSIIHEASQSGGKLLAIRRDHWKLIPTSCGISMFDGVGKSSEWVNPCAGGPRPGEPPGQLYNLADDPREQKNVYAQHPEIVRQLTQLLDSSLRDGRSRPE